MVDMNKFMSEIIRLLSDLVQSVKVNEGLIRETQDLVRNSFESLAAGGGVKGLASLSQGLQDSINLLQKGVQALSIQQALHQVQDFLGEMGGNVPTGTQGSGSAPQAVSFQPPQPGQPQKKTEDTHLIKPSDLFG